MDPGLKQHTIELYPFPWASLTIQSAGLRILAPLSYLQLLKKNPSPATCSVCNMLAWQTKELKKGNVSLGIST